jgi:molybdate transport system substrate-binding protein
VTAVALVVFAAASLTTVFPRIDGHARYSFAGSNALAAQIRQGAPADLFAAADTKLPRRLHAAGHCSKPVVFTRNALVVVVPRSNPAHIRSVASLGRRGVKVVVAAAGVPVGDYTATVLRRLKLTRAVARNVVSREPDVRSVLAKVALGEADAGFVYSTDARTAKGKVRVLHLPARAQPDVEYGACVVNGSTRAAAARAFLRRLVSKTGQARLRAAGFLPLAR